VAVVTLAAGTAWRLRATPQSFAEDLPLAVADDAAYATGLWRGAIHQRAWRAVTPKITLSTAGLKKALTADPLSLTPWRRPRSN
jgi:hypothetical protein